MYLLRRHRLVWLFIGLSLSILVALFVVYDRRSPVSQFVRAYGTVAVDRWTADELDSVCIRLEPAQGTPLYWADSALSAAAKALPGAHVRQVVLVSFRDSCGGGESRLVWAVILQWTASGDTADAGVTSAVVTRDPHAIVLVDAMGGNVIATRGDKP